MMTPPREQMLNAARVDEVSSEALLAVMLKTGVVGCDVFELARRLLVCFGSVAGLVRCDWRTLAEKIRAHNKHHPEQRILGIGQSRILELAAAFELVRRGFEGEDVTVRKVRVTNAETAARLFLGAIRGWEDQENFLVLPLNSA